MTRLAFIVVGFGTYWDVCSMGGFTTCVHILFLVFVAACLGLIKQRSTVLSCTWELRKAGLVVGNRLVLAEMQQFRNGMPFQAHEFEQSPLCPSRKCNALQPRSDFHLIPRAHRLHNSPFPKPGIVDILSSTIGWHHIHITHQLGTYRYRGPLSCTVANRVEGGIIEDGRQMSCSETSLAASNFRCYAIAA